MSKNVNKYTAFFKSFSDAEDQLDFMMASEKHKDKVDTISTGSYAVDNALGGEGGLMVGRIHQYYGPAGSGKSLMAMLAIKEAQKKDPTSTQMWIDSEGTFDPRWCESLGIDLNRILLIEDDTAVNGRSLFTMLLGTPKEDAKTHELKGKSKEGFFDKIINGEFNTNVIVLDSLGGLIPPQEDINTVGKAGIALLPRFLSTTFKKVSLEVKKSKAAFIVINHKKDNMDPYGKDHTFSGGNSFTHFLTSSIYFEAIQRKDAMVLDDKENKVGQAVRVSVEKTKAGAQGRTEIKLHFGRGVIDLHEEIANLALGYDIVTKPTSMSYEYGDRKWVGSAKFMDAVKEDQDLANELAVKIKDARLNKWNKKEPSEAPPVVEKPKKADKSMNKGDTE